ncbi:MAG: HDOD domain-containing protein [Lentisphaerae bacterium]|nr:MAG: HDOD domain-containing protein [Lentisphaerota bacterium]
MSEHVSEIDTREQLPWWEKEPAPPPRMIRLRGINCRQIYLEFLHKIKLNRLSIMEIPDNIMRVISLLNESEFDYAEIEDLVSRSGALVGEIIKIANSAVYSRGVKINRLRDALTRLGPQKIKAVLYLYSSRQYINSDERIVDLARTIMRHSYLTGLIAGYLAQRYYPDPDNAFLAGILHDVGKLALLKEVMESYDIPPSKNTLQETSFGETLPMLHQLVGRFIAKKWNLSEDICYVLAEHHQPQHFLSDTNWNSAELCYRLTGLVHFSDIVARMLGVGSYIGKIDIFKLPVARALGIEDDPETKRFLADIPILLEQV